MKCIICNEPSKLGLERYFVIPGFIVVPNCYMLCERHRGIRLEFDDFYNEDGTRKPLDKKKFKG